MVCKRNSNGKKWYDDVTTAALFVQVISKKLCSADFPFFFVYLSSPFAVFILDYLTDKTLYAFRKMLLYDMLLTENQHHLYQTFVHITIL